MTDSDHAQGDPGETDVDGHDEFPGDSNEGMLGAVSFDGLSPTAV